MMKTKKIIVVLFICLLGSVLGFSLVASAAPQETQLTHLMRQPDISKDNVVFSYAGDLWIVPRSGGQARQLTSHPGDELFPKFSPDGKSIAFTGDYDGNPDVYVMPTQGGEPKRLTYHPGNDIVLGWAPDGKKILYRSNQAGSPPPTTQLYLVSPQGGMPDMLPVPRADLTSFSPDGHKIAYIPTSQEFRTWKRYRGGWNLPIAIYDLEKNTYEELPKSSGMDMFPMWHGNTIYFISDRDGIMNLFQYDLGNKQTKKLTNYKEYDVKWPSLGPDAIVYENGGLLYSFDLASGKATNIPVTVASDEIVARSEIKPVGDTIRGIALSPSGTRACTRGARRYFHCPGEARQPAQSDANPRNPRAESRLVPRWKMGGVSFRSLWRVGNLYAPANGRRGSPRHHGWQLLSLRPELVSRQQETSLLGQETAALVREYRREKASAD